jgi:CubicO group peptidase (beta-lactamase class C family)
VVAAVQVEGTVEPGFEPVAEAFEANFAERGEVGAGLAVYVEGRPVVDVVGGVADPVTDAPYTSDSLQLVFSTTKGATAACVLLLAQRGALDLDEPVATYWPEFARAGKGAVTVRHLLAHRAGLPVLDVTLSLEEVLAVEPVVAALAAQAPLWPPGTDHGYHAATYGWLLGEVVRRVTGRSVGRLLAEEVAGPLGLDLWIGLPPEQEPRVAPLLPSPPPDPARLAAVLERIDDPEEARRLAQAVRAYLDPSSLPVRALTLNGAFGPLLQATDLVWNRPDVHAAEIPAGNAITDARSLARMYAACVGPVDGVRLLEPETMAAAGEQHSAGPDRVLLIDTRFGLGFMLDSSYCPMLGPSSFGHPGFGGSLAFADPDRQVGFGYVMNQLQQGLSADPRTLPLIDALRTSLG